MTDLGITHDAAADVLAKSDAIAREAGHLRVSICESTRFVLDHLDERPMLAPIVEDLRERLARLDKLDDALDDLLGLPRSVR
jgi:hypothetical protein